MQYDIVIVSTLVIIGAALRGVDTYSSKENLQEIANFPPSRKNGVESNNTDDRIDAIESKNVDQDLEDYPEIQEGGRKKIKIKKKHKKFLMEALLAGLLAKSALLPIAVGFLKLLTGKALLMTMLALGLAMALTYKSATEKTVTTEVINLVPPHHHHRMLRSLPDVVQMQLEQVLYPKKYD